MKNIIFAIFSCILLFSCTSYNESKDLNIQSTQLVDSKFKNINKDFSYDEYKLLIVEYGKNKEFPDINK